MNLETFTISGLDCSLVILSKSWNKMCNLSLSVVVDHIGETYNMSPERPEKRPLINSMSYPHASRDGCD